MYYDFLKECCNNSCESSVEYIIKPRDTLYSIAKKFNTMVQKLIFLNPCIDIYGLKIGQKIYVPIKGTTPYCNNGTYYTIQPSDTLYFISQRYNVSVDEILIANNFPDPYNLIPGQVICIPYNNSTMKQQTKYSNTEYIVKNNDTLGKILNKFNVSYSSFFKCNPDIDFAKLEEGTKLNVPKNINGFSTNKAYIIKEGDSLDKLSNKYSTTIDNILIANPELKPSEFEIAGIRINIP